MFGYEAEKYFKCYVEVTRDDDPEGRWSGEDTYSDWTPPTFIKKNEKYPDVVSAYNFKSGDLAFLVYAVYSTGDSFSNAHNGAIECIGVFKTEDEAKLAQREASEFKGNRLEVTWLTGESHKIYVPWNGYFEHLSTVEVVPVSIKE